MTSKQDATRARGGQCEFPVELRRAHAATTARVADDAIDRPSAGTPRAGAKYLELRAIAAPRQELQGPAQHPRLRPRRGRGLARCRRRGPDAGGHRGVGDDRDQRRQPASTATGLNFVSATPAPPSSPTVPGAGRGDLLDRSRIPRVRRRALRAHHRPAANTTLGTPGTTSHHTPGRTTRRRSRDHLQSPAPAGHPRCAR